MRIPVSEAKSRLTDLVRRAEGGEDVVLTRHGRPAARIVAVQPVKGREGRRALLLAISASGAAKARPGASAARSQDDLYDDAGLPV
jgi:prevent-host-death family protein